jgi:hypothetical protein
MLPGDDIYEQVDRGIRLWDKVRIPLDSGRRFRSKPATHSD